MLIFFRCIWIRLHLASLLILHEFWRFGVEKGRHFLFLFFFFFPNLIGSGSVIARQINLNWGSPIIGNGCNAVGVPIRFCEFGCHEEIGVVWNLVPLNYYLLAFLTFRGYCAIFLGELVRSRGSLIEKKIDFLESEANKVMFYLYWNTCVVFSIKLDETFIPLPNLMWELDTHSKLSELPMVNTN